MGVFSDRVNQKIDSYDGNAKVLYEFSKKWQEVGNCLLGTPPSDGKEEVPQASVRFFMHGGRLKVQISPRDLLVSLFTQIDDVSEPFDQLECNLLSGKFDWKADSGRKTPY